MANRAGGAAVIPMDLLSQPPPDVYRLGPGDVLGVYIEGVLGSELVPIPNMRTFEKTPRAPEREEVASSLGYPISVRNDGTLSLPQINPVQVNGRTVEEAEQTIRKAYVDAKILQLGRDRIFVTLQHKRQVQVMVFRRSLDDRTYDALPVTRVGLYGGSTELAGKGITGKGYQITLPAYENDVLHALALTGRFPGTTAARRLIVYHHNLYKSPPQLPGQAARRRNKSAGSWTFLCASVWGNRSTSDLKM